jgi:predicted ATPase/transcriptional regulator with XRE-family HTH domain
METPFGEQLKRHRLAAGLTQEALAERASLSTRAISDLERGAKRAPRRDTVELLASALGLSGRRREAFEAAARPGSDGASHGVPSALGIPASLAPLTRLIGREREAAAVVGLLRRSETRLVTLTGPGGVGKTRLALQVAEELQDAFADGVTAVSLAPLTDPALVLSAVARALDVREDGARPIGATLEDALRGGQRLLLLDNFEHVLGAARDVAALLRACPGLKLLVTSRAPLRVSGEREYQVPPLPVPDSRRPISGEGLLRYEAVRLFAERARAAAPDFVLTDATAPDVVTVCARLDGLPLAIELAAARVKLLPPRALATRLERRLPLLTGGPRDAPARQQTLRAALAWSEGLLGPAEQVLFRRVAVFAGGCDLAAAQAVCGAGAAGDAGAGQWVVLDGLTALVDHSLVRQEHPEGSRPDGEPRFAMLETVREYARERLEQSGEVEAVQGRHAAHFLALAEMAPPQERGQQRAWLDRLAAEHDNLRAALSWTIDREGGRDVESGLRLAAALWLLWWLRGHMAEGRGWLRRALARAGTAADPILRARVLDGAGFLALTQADFVEGRVILEESLTLWRAAGDAAGIANACYALGIAALWLADYDTAQVLFEESLERYRAIGHRLGMARALERLGLHAFFSRDDRAAARARFEESLTTVGELEDEIKGETLQALGIVSLLQADYRAARAYLEDALAFTLAIGDTFTLALVLAGFAGLAAAAGLPERALRLTGFVAALRESTGARMPAAGRALECRLLVPAEAALDEPAQSTAHAAGRAMTREAAVADALATPLPADRS